MCPVASSVAASPEATRFTLTWPEWSLEGGNGPGEAREEGSTSPPSSSPPATRLLIIPRNDEDKKKIRKDVKPQPRRPARGPFSRAFIKRDAPPSFTPEPHYRG